jgi:threonine/homoserine/homoserine lactone efflux protein
MSHLTLALAPLALFAVAASITPGPNNLLVMRSGARHGLRPTWPHIVGIEIGFGCLIVLCYAGVGALLLALPLAAQILQWLAVAYLLWLALGMLREKVDDDAPGGAPERTRARPMSLVEAMLFQIVNPKAWMMAVTGVSAFGTNDSLTALDLLVVLAVFLGVGFPSVSIWAAWGAVIHRVLHRPAARRAFNWTMAVLIVLSALLMLRSEQTGVQNHQQRAEIQHGGQQQHGDDEGSHRSS